MFTSHTQSHADVSSMGGNRTIDHSLFQGWGSRLYVGDRSVVMPADAYVPPAIGRGVGKLKKQARHIEATFRTRDAVLVGSFAAMRWEMNQLWSGVQAANAGHRLYLFLHLPLPNPVRTLWSSSSAYFPKGCGAFGAQ